MKILKCLSLVFCLSALVGCLEQKVENGEVPEKYLDYAQRFVGSYSGSFSGIANKIHIKLEGHKLILTADNDLLGKSCETEIGDLYSVWGGTRGNKVYLKQAKFYFDTNKCSHEVLGRKLMVRTSMKHKQNRLYLSVVQSYRPYYHCYPYYGQHGHYYRNCYWDYIAYYITGRFDRE